MPKNLTPITNTEKLMSAIAGNDVHFATPITNVEWFLYDIYEAVSSGGGGGEGTTNYNLLNNKPQINGVILSGNKTTSDLNINIPDVSNFITNAEVEELLADYVTETVFDNTIAGFYTKSQVDTALSGKVDKVSGKGLSTNDYTTAEKTKLAGLENYDDSDVQSDISDLQTALSGKVDKVSGKGLSTNDYTTAEKTRLASLGDGATTVTVTSSVATVDRQSIQRVGNIVVGNVSVTFTQGFSVNAKVDLLQGLPRPTESRTTVPPKSNYAFVPWNTWVGNDGIYRFMAGSAISSGDTLDIIIVYVI